MRESLTTTTRSRWLGLALGCLAVSAWAAAPAKPQGVITARSFLDIGTGTAITDLTGNAKFPGSPDEVAYPSYFELNASGDIYTAAVDTRDGYGGQIVGYFYPPVTGDYVFYLASDDNGNLYLSTDDTPANKKLIAQETGWSGARSYYAAGGGNSTVEAKCSQSFTGTEWATKDPSGFGGAQITLQAGKAYYIEALFKEGTGGDNLSVSAQDPAGYLDPNLPIAGEYLSTIDKATGAATIVTQPQSQTVDEGNPATFSVTADGTPPYRYQWSKERSDHRGRDQLDLHHLAGQPRGQRREVQGCGNRGLGRRHQLGGGPERRAGRHAALRGPRQHQPRQDRQDRVQRVPG